MRKILCFLLILLFTLQSCRKNTNDQTSRITIVDSTLSAFQYNFYKAEIDSVFARHRFNGTVSILQDSTILYSKQNGFENFENKKKIDPQTVFAIGSLSKQFTAVLILLQEEQGRLKLSDPVSKYLTEFQSKPFEQITVEQLLNHTSGVNDRGNGLQSKPGEEFNYSNKGYRFLGKIIEKVSGKSFDENAKALFAKAGMRNSTTASEFSGNNFASAYSGTSSLFHQIENMPKRLSNDEISVPAGGILSSVNDLNSWNLALYGGKIIKPESLQKFEHQSSSRKHPVLGDVGYGLGIMMSQGEPRAFFHTGYVKGSPSLNIFYPDTKTSVIILSNIADESRGKNEIFTPHKEVKMITDAVERAVKASRKALVKPVIQQ